MNRIVTCEQDIVTCEQDSPRYSGDYPVHRPRYSGDSPVHVNRIVTSEQDYKSPVNRIVAMNTVWIWLV